MFTWFFLLVLCSIIHKSSANTEKTIFVAPEALATTQSGPTLAALGLDTLSPSQSVLRTSLAVTFPHKNAPLGNQSWYLLSGLQPDKRYEVRVCWAATQPTQFILEHHSVNTVFDTASLIQDLSVFAEAHQPLANHATNTHGKVEEQSPQALLFLRVWAAADFFSLNDTLMNQPLTVDVDIILDPYVLNIFPVSLLPTGAYVLIIGAISWPLSKLFWNWLQSSISLKQHAD